MNGASKYKRYALQVSLSLLALMSASACGGPSRGGQALADAPKETEAIYRARCLSCHGTELQGRVGNETNLRQVGARLTEADIALQIREGGEDGLMPAFGDQLTAEEIAGLAAWLAGKQ